MIRIKSVRRHGLILNCPNLRLLNLDNAKNSIVTIAVKNYHVWAPSVLHMSRRTVIKKLPKIIGNMINLLELHLGGCKELTCLPKSIGKVVNLSTLDVWGCIESRVY
ncbi:hypothetical protein M758_11G094000 [Ceratodon purpureus]|nr:hypothetical protein M758_11G094000 [Ceratodon purpureus]